MLAGPRLRQVALAAADCDATASHLRHLPVADADGLLGVIDITDVCRALNTAVES